MNGSYERICVEFERKNNTTLVYLLTYCPQVRKIFYDWPVKYYFLTISVHHNLLKAIRIEFSCLYIPQGHYLVSACGYEVQMNMEISPSLKAKTKRLFLQDQSLYKWWPTFTFLIDRHAHRHSFMWINFMIEWCWIREMNSIYFLPCPSCLNVINQK